MKRLLHSASSTLLGLYLASITLAIPYFNWEYAKKNGFFSWLFAGEIVPTCKAVIWPYYAFRGKTPKTAPDLSVDELSVYSRVIARSNVQKLTKNDIDTIKQVMRDYSERTGAKVSQEQYNYYISSMKLINDYQYELALSALYSWDNKQYTTTQSFDILYKQFQKTKLRREKQLAVDNEVLKAAASNQNFLADESGQQYEFSRARILSRLKNSEMEKGNTSEIAIAMKELME